MTSWKRLGSVMLITGALCAQQMVQDPVLMARNQRAAAGTGDLPPVPRAILEPPPMPAPETHVKDAPGWKASRAARTARASRDTTAGKDAPVRKSVKAAKGKPTAKSASASKGRPAAGRTVKKLPKKKKR